MTIRILKPIQGGTIRAIASKSEAHRLLICAALAGADSATPADKKTFISCADRSEDIDATVRCLQAIGAALRYENNGFFVTPIDRTLIQPCGMGEADAEPKMLDCAESGATLRFLLPVCAALGLPVSFNMKGRLPERPLSSLWDEILSHGCTLSRHSQSHLVCKGQLKSGTYTLPGNISSQFVSGLLLALPLLSGSSIIRVTDILESRPYVDMTLDALRLFGITVIEEEAQVFSIKGGQTGASPGNINVSGDWSNAAFWLCAGAIGKNAGFEKSAVSCTGLDLDSRQGDRAIVDLLERFGAIVTRSKDAITVSPGKPHGIEIDAGDTPDLVPVLAAVASVAEGKTIIRNAKRLRIKESDRLATVAKLLSSLGADITETEDGLVINGRKILSGGETQSYGDHRIAMTAAILSGMCEGPVIIRDAEAVNKSYPYFFEDYKALGGQYEYLR